MAVQLRTALFAATLLIPAVAYAEPATPNPVIKNPNPASSETTDESGVNPLVRQGENSPTGKGPSVSTNPPTNATVGSGVKNQQEEQEAK